MVDGILEPAKRKYGLPKGLDYWNTPHVFHRFVGHIPQCILVFVHLFFEPRSRHLRHHDHKAQCDRHQTEDPEPPVKGEEHKDKPHWSHISSYHVRQLMSQIGFRRSGAFIDCFSDLAASQTFHNAKRQGHDMVHHVLSQIGLHTKGCNMGAHQPGYVYQHGCHCRDQGHPAVIGKFCRLSKIRHDI